jgi:DNA-binding PadR family transcriptional regulator
MRNPPVLEVFDLVVLAAVLTLREDASGASVQEKVAEISGQIVPSATLTLALARLEGRKLVTSFLTEPTRERWSQRSRFYRLTPLGADILRNNVGVARRLCAIVNEAA